MRSTTRLNLDDILLELEAVEIESTRKILGGNLPKVIPTIDGGELEEVVIDGGYYGNGTGSQTGTGLNWGGTSGSEFSGGGYTGSGGSGGGGGGNGGGSGGGGGSNTYIPLPTDIVNQPGYWSYVGNEYVYTVNGGALNEVTITADMGYSANDAVGVMLSSMGLAADHADVAAAIMKLETKGFIIASRGFGILGMAQNAVQMFEKGEWNVRDVGQIGLGAALLIPGLNGAIAIGGGAILFGWELYELMNE